ncbi:MAG: exo-beta-N-acetylmuramidase NamZ family protein [Vicingaceae bacterium]
MNLSQISTVITICLLCFSCSGQVSEKNIDNTTNTIIKVKPTSNLYQKKNIKPIIVGAARTNQYLSLLKGKKVGVVANHTSMINSTHLVDSLIGLKVNVVRAFSPEHGFRGKADAGEKVNSNIDQATGLPIVSLYGKNKKPFPEQIADLDVLIFDIQDVGVRFYTYISTMSYVMEACAENNKKIIVLDRPNPNGHFVDGPILEKKHQSFVGLHPVPIAHGMTVGEYAKMVNGEGWLANGVKCDLTVIKAENYDHNTFYDLPIKPSPNLPNMSSIYLYPSLCLFEGTPISVGRGTQTPFQVLGHPQIKSDSYVFTPKSMDGAKSPKLEGKKCYGYNLSEFGGDYIKNKGGINLFWLIDIYSSYPKKEGFFTKMFLLLSGTDQLQQQLENNVSEEEIYKSWQPGLTNFKTIRKQYLLYKDFE